MAQNMDAQRTGKIAPGAARIDARDESSKGNRFATRLGFEGSPEFGLERDRGAMARDG